jgi:hypothetical protein
MAAATNAQVQAFVDARIRPRCEQIRGLLNALVDDIAAIDDVYAALTVGSPTWTDGRTDAPPHLLTPADVLSINTMLNDLKTAISGNAQLPIVRKACVRAV